MSALRSGLAWAAARQIATKIGAFTLFATHYFELTALPAEVPAAANVHLAAAEHGRELIFLHSVRPGPANQSYGLQVAELAGGPGSRHPGRTSTCPSWPMCRLPWRSCRR